MHLAEHDTTYRGTGTYDVGIIHVNEIVGEVRRAYSVPILCQRLTEEMISESNGINYQRPIFLDLEMRQKEAFSIYFGIHQEYLCNPFCISIPYPRPFFLEVAHGLFLILILRIEPAALQLLELTLQDAGTNDSFYELDTSDHRRHRGLVRKARDGGC